MPSIDLLLPLVAFNLGKVLPWIHIANVLYLASYSVRDIFWLRILTVVAMLCMFPYYFSCAANPLWEPIVWNSLFLGVNLWQIFLLIRERWPVALQGLEREIYEKIFHALTPGEFTRLLKLGEWRDMKHDEILVQDGEVVQEMMLLCAGDARVLLNDVELARLKSGQFIGEMSFLTQEKASASVAAGDDTKVLAWPQEELQAYLDKHSDLSFKLRGILGRDLVRKLQAEKARVLRSDQEED